MSRLPSFGDLGQASTGGGERPIGQIDGTSIGRAYERLGTGLTQLGTGAGDLQERQSRYDASLAHAGFVSDMISLNANTQRELNYGPDANGNDLSQRYSMAATGLRDKWGASVGSAPMRRRFDEISSELIAQGQAQANTRAFNLYKDHQIAATDVLGEDLGNKAVATDDPNVHAQAMDAYRGATDALAAKGLISQDDAVKRKRAFGSNLAQGLLIQQAQSDPLGALNHIRSAPGSDDELVERIIQIESGHNPRAKAKNSTAEGLGQFTDATWLDTIKKTRPDLAKSMSDQDLLALKADPNLSRQMTGALLQSNRSSLQAQGLEGSAGNLYLAHFLGAGGAAKLLKASPDTPVSKLLSQDAIDANGSILAGRTAGSVIQWANGRMGGYSPGEGSIYSFIPPMQRANLETRLLGMTQSKNADDQAQFKQRYQDSIAEAFNTGIASKPLSQSEFVRTYGGADGLAAYKDYQAQLQLGADKQRVATLSPEEQTALYDSYLPKPGSEGYADALKRQAVLGKAIDEANKERVADPAGYAVRNLPPARDAWQNLSATLSNPTADQATKTQAARDFADKTAAAQIRAGVAPTDVRILPKTYVDQVNKGFTDAATSDSAGARVGLIPKVQQEAALWGSAWPDVVRQLTPHVQPVVRAIAAGADPNAMARLLSLDPKENPRAVLKEQSETKASDLTKALNTEMSPFLSTMVGRQRDRDFFDYYNLADKLSALYVRDGKDASTAAHDAFNALIGSRYDFRDTYRIPKDSGVAADDVQAGAMIARHKLDEFGVKPAADNIGGLSNADADSLKKFGRDGTWVTSPDNSGLNLMYQSRSMTGPEPVTTKDGKPLSLSWAQLAKLGGSKEARDEAMRQATEFGGAANP